MTASTSARRQRRNALLFLAPAAGVLVLIYLGPMLFALRTSFTAWIFTSPGSEDIYVGLENYNDVLMSPEPWSAVRVTLIYAFVSICCGLTLGTAVLRPLLLPLDHDHSDGDHALGDRHLLEAALRRGFRRLLHSPARAGSSSVGAGRAHGAGYRHPDPLYLAASRAGLLDRRPTLIVAYCAFNLPFAVWLLRGFFREIPNELREAAIVDGCSKFQVFWKIMVPLVGGGLVATSVFVFIGAWNEFLFALALTQSNTATAPLAVIGFHNEYGARSAPPP